MNNSYFAKRYEEIKAKAEAGDKAAMWQMWMVLRSGNKSRGIAKDASAADYWLLKSINAGSVVALWLLGREEEKSPSSGTMFCGKDKIKKAMARTDPESYLEFAEYERMNAESSESARMDRACAALGWYRKALAAGIDPERVNASIAWCESVGGVGVVAVGTVVKIGEKKKKMRKEAYAANESLVDIEIAEGVERIDDSAFRGCTNLRSVVLPATIREIGWAAFAECPKLETVRMTDGVIKLEDRAFEGCVSLKELVLPNSVSEVGAYVFQGCASIDHVVLGLNLKSIGCAMFCNCKSLAKVEVPFGVEEIQQVAFQGCENLMEVLLPDSITKIGWSAFEGCASLKTVKLPSKLGDLASSVFKGCSALDAIDVPSSLKEVDRMAFSDCTALRKVVLHEGLLKILFNAFEGCVSLTSLELPDSLISLVDECFKGCTNLVAFKGPVGVKYGERVFDGCLKLPELIIEGELVYAPNKAGSIVIRPGVRRIVDNVFYNCAKLESVSMPSTLESIGSQSFAGCSRLVSVNLPDSLKSMGDGAFAGCTSLEVVRLPPSATQVCASTFRRCSKLRDVNFPHGLEKIGRWAFFGCASLCEIRLPDSLEDVDIYAFAGCSSIEQLEIPASVQSIHEAAFENCVGLRRVTVAFGALRKDEGKGSGCRVFVGCTNVEVVQIPRYVDLGAKDWFGDASPQTIELLDEQNEIVDPASLMTDAGRAFLAKYGFERSKVSYWREAGYDCYVGCRMQAPSKERTTVEIPSAIRGEDSRILMAEFYVRGSSKWYRVFERGKGKDPIESYALQRDAKASRYWSVFAGLCEYARSMRAKR